MLGGIGYIALAGNPTLPPNAGPAVRSEADVSASSGPIYDTFNYYPDSFVNTGTLVEQPIDRF